MIPTEDHLEQKRVYTKGGKGLWRIIAFCQEPSITMQNIITHQREDFGISGFTAQSFKPIPGIKAGDGESIIEIDE